MKITKISFKNVEKIFKNFEENPVRFLPVGTPLNTKQCVVDAELYKVRKIIEGFR